MERLPRAMLEAGHDQAGHSGTVKFMHGIQLTANDKKQGLRRDHIPAGHATAQPAKEVPEHKCDRSDGEKFLHPHRHRDVFGFYHSPGRH